MRILVTGGSGLLGAKIAEIASDRGYDVYSGYYRNKPEFGEMIKFNLTDPKSIQESVNDVGPDVIIHAAALTDVDACETNRDLAYLINSRGTRLVAEASQKSGSFMVYVSTDYVFDGSRGFYMEDDKPNPINYYGYTKLLGEKYCENIARTCVIYGAREAGGKVNFALWLIENLKKGEEVKIVTDQYITPTLNTNLARMLLEIVEDRIAGVFHLAGATRVSRYEFALKIADKFGLDESLIRPARMDEMDWVAKRPKDSSLDTSKARGRLKEKPYDLRKSLNILMEEIRGVGIL